MCAGMSAHVCVSACHASHRTKPDPGSDLHGAPAALVQQRCDPDRGGNNCGMRVSWEEGKSPPSCAH